MNLLRKIIGYRGACIRGAALLFIAISFPRLNAFANSTQIKITSSNKIDFLKVGNDKGLSVYCHLKPVGRPDVGTAKKVVARSTTSLFWKSYSQQIAALKRAPRTPANKKALLELSKKKAKFLAVCEQMISLAATPTASPSPSQTPKFETPTATPSPSASASASPTATATISASPTATMSASPTATKTATPTQSPSQSPTATPTPSASQTPSPTPIPTPGDYYIRCGVNPSATPYQDANGHFWQNDAGLYSGSTNTFSTSSTIIGSSDPLLYKAERFGIGGASFAYEIPVVNGEYEVTLHFAEIYFNIPAARVFNVAAEGTSVISNLDIWSQVGKNVALTQTFEVDVADGALSLNFSAISNNAKIAAIEIHPHAHGHPFLHVVIQSDSYVVDYDSSGSESFPLDGSGSHTHQLGHALTGYLWSDGAVPLGTSQKISPSLAVGRHNVSLQITDDNNPPQSFSDSTQIDVFPIQRVGGVVAEYYSAQSVSLSTLIDVSPLPTSKDFEEILPSFTLIQNSGKIAGSSFSGNYLVVLRGNISISASGTYYLGGIGGSAARVFIDGNPVNGAAALSAGYHALEARFAIDNVALLPAYVAISTDGFNYLPVPRSITTHDETSFTPFIKSMPTTGSSLGGETITISGLGFFPSNAVTVTWGGTNITGADLTVKSNAITFLTPPGSGVVPVSVTTPQGTSNEKIFTYNGGVPIAFESPVSIAAPYGPTQAAWGPDGRFYVGTITGLIRAYSFDDDYNVISTEDIGTLTSLTNSNILGIGFNPFDPPSPVKIYVAHGQLFASNNGDCANSLVPYSGEVSILSNDAPSTWNETHLITGLPVSNHDHGINGLSFDNNGDLYIAVGGMTNAGIPDCTIGNVPESPLSGAILKARLSDPLFSGTVAYKVTATGTTSLDERDGDTVDQAPGSMLDVYAAGFRNPFDIVWSTRGILYGTDNGPNSGFGPTSLSANTQGPPVARDDEINLLTDGHYYGHPNRNRGRYDNRQNAYGDPFTASVLGKYTAPIAFSPPVSSTDGIDEYRATTFLSELRGALISKRYTASADIYASLLSDDGFRITDMKNLGQIPGLDVVASPGGALMLVNYDNVPGLSDLKILKPHDLGALPMQAYDIFPWRSTSGGGIPFVIGGIGFGTLANTTVTFGGASAVLTSVTSTRIKGIIPASANPTAQLIDVAVASNGRAYTIPQAFRYVFQPGAGIGEWKDGSSMPLALSEVASGVINGVMYVVGEGDNNTYAYDINDGTWTNVNAPRPYIGDHHAAEVINQKLYLFGGLGGGAGTRVQIYNPDTNSWTLGANNPNDIGSASTAYINGKVYVAGGILPDSTTTTALTIYDVQSNTWSTGAPMPAGRNHTAAGTDGKRMYIFGGRIGGNVTTNGFDDVFIYDPVLNAWYQNADGLNSVPRLPKARGGMGKAVYFRGEFYVIGGERADTCDAGVPNNVCARVDVYNPVTRTWRLDKPLKHGLHGIFPVLADGRIFSAGGSNIAGLYAPTPLLQLYNQ